MARVFKADASFNRQMLQGASCVFGVFDGVHKGHQYLISQAKETAAENGGEVVALTFDVDPDELFRADALKKLMTNQERIQALCNAGVDAVVVLPFTREFAAQPPDEFLAATFGDAAPFAIHVGEDFRFGAKAAGSVEDLKAWFQSKGTRVCGHRLKCAEGQSITATRIRGLLAQAELDAANELLGRPYAFSGVVQPGRGEGAGMGFATANLELPVMMQVLAEGVYAAYVTVGQARYKAAVNVGVARTFADATATCEAHILDFQGEIYGETIQVEPVKFLRPVMAFPSVEQLIATVKDNIEWVRANL